MPDANNSSSSVLTLYSFPLSGHGHRAELFLSLLGLPVKVINVDLPKGEQKQEQFLSLNPMGQIPVLLDGDIVVSDSNAILVYLARKYGNACWLPDDPVGASQVQRFLSLAAGEVFRGPASARMVRLFGAPFNWELAQATASRLFHFLDDHLSQREYLATAQPTIADIACYSYIAHAAEGGLSLDEFAHLRTWLSRIEALPGFIAMQKSPAALAA
ncbi:glutathione S-transferase [Undibacterium sp. TS12]|uniref:glutathione S-transferase family protein n=1 Tax=Undibacterium sp. TS12 TaxID=2908202 RepID=UPI001F4C9F7B|nr:glutathione S-transferase [Undibacterium sp. TS12]MCH8619269.1 glutathione S-transferase [Undibacterium sp. TS12]